MKHIIRIMIVEDNPHLAETIQSFLASKENIEVVATAQNAQQAIEQMAQAKPQIVILDMVMPQADGFVFLEYLNNTYRFNAPQVIVLSAVANDSIIRRARELGAVYYLVKPFSMTLLYERIQVLLSGRLYKLEYNEDPATMANTEKRIRTAFLSAGIPANLKGYYYLSEAIKMTIIKPELIHQMTKRLYPELGEKFHTTASNVERAIRHVIQSAWISGRLERFNGIFSTNNFSFADKPTNSELISLFIQYLS